MQLLCVSVVGGCFVWFLVRFRFLLAVNLCDVTLNFFWIELVQNVQKIPITGRRALSQTTKPGTHKPNKVWHSKPSCTCKDRQTQTLGNLSTWQDQFFLQGSHVDGGEKKRKGHSQKRTKPSFVLPDGFDNLPITLTPCNAPSDNRRARFLSYVGKKREQWFIWPALLVYYRIPSSSSHPSLLFFFFNQLIRFRKNSSDLK